MSALRAVAAGLCVVLAAAWIARVPDVAGATLGLLSSRFGPVTWVAAAGTVLGVLGHVARGGTGALGGTLGAAMVLLAKYGLDVEVTRRRSALIALACIAIPWILHLALRTRKDRALPWILVGAGAAAGTWSLHAIDLRPYRTALPTIEASAAPAGAPDIVLITLDTTRYDALAAAAPTLEAFARDSIAFPNTTAESPFTHPSMATLVTSRAPLEHGSVSTSPWIDPRLPTLATHLRRHGYRTAGFLDNPWLSPDFGLSEGYEHLDRRTDLDRIEGWLGRSDDERPMLLHVHLFHPHGPYELRPEYLERLGREVDPDSRDRLGDTIDANYIRAGEVPGVHHLSEADFRWLETIYLTEVAAMDEWLTEFLELLAERDPNGERTIIAITADHGEEFGDHGALHHSHTLYEELVHVPLLLRVPGSQAQVDPRSAGLIDVAPTLLDAAGLPPLPRAAGTSLLADAPATRARVSTRYFSRRGHQFSIRIGEWKLHLHIAPRGDALLRRLDFAKEAPPESIELYRLSEDPGELRNLAKDEPERVIELQRALQSWHDAAIDRVESEGLGSGRDDPQRAGQRTIEQLRALGYSTEVR